MISTTHSVISGDARCMDSVASESVHAAVTSPPYPMIEMWDEQFASLAPSIGDALADVDGPLAFELMHRELDRTWAEVYRVLVPGGFACINIGDATRSVAGKFRLYSNHARILSSCTDLGFQALPLILWRKQTNAPNKFMGSGMLPAGAYVTLEHEYILVLRKGGKREFSNPEDKERRRRGAYFWEERNTWFSDVWDFKGARQALELEDREGRKRSAAYPFELAYRLVNMYALPGDTVLDPYLGTGTTSLASMASCRNSVGFEIDPALGRTAIDRLARDPAALNKRILDRLEAHRTFVAERLESGRQIKHYNEPHGFPVVTGQEATMHLHFVDHVDQQDSITTAHHAAEPPSTSATHEEGAGGQQALDF